MSRSALPTPLNQEPRDDAAQSPRTLNPAAAAIVRHENTDADLLLRSERMSPEAENVPQSCPCGCGRLLPAPVAGRLESAARVMERWVEGQGLTMGHLKRPDRRPEMVEMRRQVARYLSEHGWSTTRIGEFLDRDYTSVINLLRPRKARRRGASAA